MIIHSPVISGSLTFADGSTLTLPPGSTYSGSFSGSHQGDVFEGGIFTGDGSQLSFNGTGIISSSAQIDALFDIDGLVSSSAQVEFNDVNNTPFSQSASSVTVSKSIIPTDLNIDLGTPSTPFKDLYLSSASLYIDGTQVLSSNASEITLTTDVNQSLKLVETGADTVQIQTENGDITLTATGTGNIELDAPIQIVAGNQILSSDGNAIAFGEDIDITGNITVSGTVDGIDLQAFSGSVANDFAGLSTDYNDLENIPVGIVSGSSQVVLENADKTGFTGASSITTLGTIVTGDVSAILPAGVISGSVQLPIGVVSGSIQVDINSTSGELTTLGTVSTGDVSAILPVGTVSGSSQVDINSTSGDLTSLGTVNTGDVSAILPAGSVSGSSQVDINATSGLLTSLGTVTVGSVDAILPNGVVSGSSQVDIEQTTNFNTFSSSLASTDSGLDSRITTLEGTDIDVTLSGDVSGTGTITNLGNVSITTTVADDSHNHTIANVDGLQTALDGKVATNSVQALANGTALSLATNTLTLTKGDGTTDTVDLSAYLDEDSRSIASGTLNGATGIVTFTRDDATTFTLDLSDLLDDTNLVTSVNGANGVVVLDTGDISENGNLYFTTGRVDAHLSGGTGVSYSAGEISIGQSVGTGDTVQFGKVGVGGASDATYELKVTGDIGATGDVVAYVSSDERLKDNIEVIDNPIEKVQALKGVTWEWNDNASDAAKQSPNLGVIAQDVEKVLPQLVHDRENGYKGVDYGKLTGLLIEAIKDQQKQIDELKSRLQ